MKKIKIYILVCSYILEGSYLSLDVPQLLERLHRKKFSGVDDNLKYIVEWNIKHSYKVKYEIKTKLEFPQNVDYIYSSVFNDSHMKEMANKMNRLHDQELIKLSDEDAEKYFRKYGNDYTKRR